MERAPPGLVALMAADDLSSEARKVAEEILEAMGWLSTGQFVGLAQPLLLAFAKRVREPLLYTSDKQTVAWKERALGAEAEAARLKAELENWSRSALPENATDLHELRVELMVHGWDSVGPPQARLRLVLRDADSLRAQLSEAQAGRETYRQAAELNRQAWTEAQQRVEALEKALREKIAGHHTELFEDGVATDLFEAGVRRLPDAYMAGYQDACSELADIARAALAHPEPPAPEPKG